MLIVDDDAALIGSANINDRSQIGVRDSEIAIVVEDGQTFFSPMNGENVSVRKFAHTLRLKCFTTIFGLSEEQVRDPLSE